MALFIAIAVLGTITFLFVLFSKWRYQYWSRKGVPQFEPKLIFGDYKPVLTGSTQHQQHFLNIYNNAKAKGFKYIGLYKLLIPELMTLDLKLAKSILLKDFDHFPGHGLYHHKSEPLTENLFHLEGEEWKKLRIKLTPTFTTGKMKMMFETLLEKADVLQKVVSQSAMNNEIQVKETLARFGTDVIGSVAFGIACNSLEEDDNQLRKIGKKTFEPSMYKFFVEEFMPTGLVTKFGYKNLDSEISTYFTDMVKETIAYREKNNVQRKDFMHLMLQLKNQGDKNTSVTEQEIITESFLFYLAGFETSSTATTFALLELSKNQHVQDKLRQEIIDVLKKNNNKLSYDALMEMEYLDRVMHETLRKYPPVAFIPRLCSKGYKVPDSDVFIEKGTRVYIPAWGIQLDPEYYPNPEAFNPDNFSPENKAKRPDFTWLPFGEGPRMCIGLRFGMMQSKVALVTLLKSFKFSPHEKTTWPLVMAKGTIVLSVEGDVWLQLKKL